MWLYLLNCLIPTHKFSYFLPSNSLSLPTGRGVSKQLCGAELPTGLNHDSTSKPLGKGWPSLSACQYQMVGPWYAEFTIQIDRVNFTVFSILPERREFPENSTEIICSLWWNQLNLHLSIFQKNGSYILIPVASASCATTIWENKKLCHMKSKEIRFF